MDLAAVRALGLTVAHETHGVFATVTVPDGVPVETSGIWVQHADEVMPVGRDFAKRQPRRVLQVPLTDALPAVPRGTLIVAAPRGSTVQRTWRVENVDIEEADWVRVIVAFVS